MIGPIRVGGRTVNYISPCLPHQQKAMLHYVYVFCSTNRRLLLCGMHSGFIRVYPLQEGDLSHKSMRAYWTLSVHDNQYGHLRHIRSSYDDQFVLTAGDDGNIFSFSLLAPEGQQRDQQKMMAMIPSTRVSLHAPSAISHTPAQGHEGPGACLCIRLTKIQTPCQKPPAYHRADIKKQNSIYFPNYHANPGKGKRKIERFRL